MPTLPLIEHAASVARVLPGDRDIEELLANDPLLSAYGSGKDLWTDEHADEYVANLRAGWG